MRPTLPLASSRVSRCRQAGRVPAVVEQAGAKSQLASLVGAGIVVSLLLFFNSLLADLPQSALAAVLIAAALSLLDLDALARYYRYKERTGPLVGRQRGRDRARGPAGDRPRHRPRHAVVLPPRSATSRRGPG